jgi:hypothetical protein
VIEAFRFHRVALKKTVKVLARHLFIEGISCSTGTAFW